MHRIQKDAIFLVDGSSILYRSYYGLRPLHTATGIPTQATYGFCRSIKKLIDDFDPKYLVIAWDSKGKTFRSEIFKDYKATRQAPPSDLFSQKEDIVEFAKLTKIAQIAKPGYEADDLIYSFIKDHKNKQIIIVGPDKDLQQLLSPHILILDPLKKEIMDEKNFKEKRGFEPEKLVFYHALVGDTSDNIPGVNGIGPKSATELVTQFDSLDDLYKNLDKVKKERIKNLLEQYKDNAFLSQKLFSLEYTSPEISLKDIHFDKDNWKEANALFKKLEFKSLMVGGVEQQTSFLPEQELSAKATPWECIIIKDEILLQELIERLHQKKFFALDTETTGLLPLQDELVGISIAYDTKKAYYIPLTHTQNHQLDRNKVLELLKPILTSKTIKKTLHNTKFDQLVLLQYGIELHGIECDTLLIANLLRKDWDKIGLKNLSLVILHEKMSSFAEVLGKQYKTFKDVPIHEAAIYAAHDALQTFKLTKILTEKLHHEPRLEKIYETMELPLSQVLVDMELTGVTLDREVLKDLEHTVNRKLTTLEEKILGVLPHKSQDINLNSPKQIEKLLFDILKLPVVKKSSKGQRSTDQEVLEELSEQHPVPGLILQYRELYKLKSTYIEALPLTINPKTNRIHTSYSQTMVATGRLSSSDPNLQNIPAGGEFGIKIREAFIAPRGYKFLSADYSQIELRVLAHVTKDKNLTEAFLHNRDIHAQTAAELFEVPLSQVTDEQRQIGKRINFSIIYGMTPYGLSKDLGIKPSEAKVYIEKYFAKYPKVAEWAETIVEQAKHDGYVTTWLGRKRYIPGLHEQNKHLFEAAKRVAVNSPIQGTSAEIMKLAMINLYKHLNKFSSRIILQIHDELILECPNDEVETVEKLVKKEMESVVSWEIPLTVSVRKGKNWGEVT